MVSGGVSNTIKNYTYGAGNGRETRRSDDEDDEPAAAEQSDVRETTLAVAGLSGHFRSPKCGFSPSGFFARRSVAARYVFSFSGRKYAWRAASSVVGETFGCDITAGSVHNNNAVTRPIRPITSYRALVGTTPARYTGV